MPTIANRFHATLLVLLPLLGVLWVMQVPFFLGLPILTASYLSVFAGLGIASALLIEARAGRRVWMNLILAVTAIACWTWGGINHEAWLASWTRGPDKWIPSAVALILLFEALRRVCGTALTAVVLVSFAYGFGGHMLPGIVEGAYTAPPRLVLYLFNDTNGVPGVVLRVCSTIVLSFIVMGAVMREVGASSFFTDLAMALMGRRRGGPAKVAVLASSLFGTISGSTLGNIMSTGVVTIPLMKRSGFPAHTSGAIEAVASNGGQLAPPVMGATAFLIAEFMQVPYSDVVYAAVIPALVYYVVLFLQIDAIAVRLKIERIDRSELPSAVTVLKSGWPYLVPLALLAYLLFGTGTAPARAAIITAAAMVVAGTVVQRKIFGLRAALNVLESSGRTLVTILIICAGAGIVIGVLNITGLGFLLTNALSHVGASLGMFAMLVLTALIAIILGMGMPTAAVYILLSIILAPALTRMGVEPMAAHLYIFYFGLLSMITPPVAIASYSAAAIANADPWKTGLAGLRLGVAAYVLPFMFSWEPALVGQGTLWEKVAVGVNVLAIGYLLAIALSKAEGFTRSTDGWPTIGLLTLAAVVLGLGQFLGTAHILAFVGSLLIPAAYRFVANNRIAVSRG